MRKTAFAGLFALAIVGVGSLPSRAHAQDILDVNRLSVANLTVETAQPSVIASLEANREEQQVQPAVEPEVQKYTVTDNDSLTTIAERHSTTWQRLFYKNAVITNPDVLTVGTELVIPTADEELAERPLPESAPAPSTTGSRSSTAAVSRGSSAGNSYTPGYCTWYAKNMRPDMPNNLGNANTWVSRAAAQGLATGSAPRVGAIGQQGMHVVYVESVNGDGTVTISEMNYNGVFVISSRTVPASTFMYIY